MITKTLQEASVPNSNIVVTVVEEVLRHIEPRHACYAAYAMGTDPRNGEWFRKAFSRCPSERAARHAANGFFTQWGRIAHNERKKV